jgi:hypothetical protein
MDWKKLLLNALLAGFWAGLAALQVGGELNEAALWAAGVAFARAAIGYIADQLGKPVPVDQ